MICYLTFAAPKTFSTLVHEMTADLVSLHPPSSQGVAIFHLSMSHVGHQSIWSSSCLGC